MATVQIRDLPDDVHEALKRRAQLEGRSLNKLIVDELRQAARRGRNREIFERASRLPWAQDVSSGEATRMIREMRDAVDRIDDDRG